MIDPASDHECHAVVRKEQIICSFSADKRYQKYDGNLLLC